MLINIILYKHVNYFFVNLHLIYRLNLNNINNYLNKL